jgi:hypothetical protein
MDQVEEIETAIDRLSPEEYRRVVEWLRAREQTHWDEQFDGDSAAGKLFGVTSPGLIGNVPAGNCAGTALPSLPGHFR